MIRKRHHARSVALQILYAEEFAFRSGNPYEDNSESMLDGNDEDVRAYIIYLIGGVRENKDKIDSVISQFSAKRSIPEIDIVDLCILRIAVYSLLFDKSVHPSIIIDEAVKLSQEFSTEINYRFINGILDAYVKSCQS